MTSTRNLPLVEFEEGPATFDKLPEDVFRRMIDLQSCHFEAVDMMMGLLQTCRKFSFFKENGLFNKRIAGLCVELLKEYDVSNIKMLLQKAPAAVLVKIPKIDLLCNGQTFTYLNYTLFQFARAEGDTTLCEMLKPFFIIACGGEEAAQIEMKAQFDEKFSDESIAKAKRKKIIYKLLEPLLKEINTPRFLGKQGSRWVLHSETFTAIETFRKDFMANQPLVIKTGVRFDINLIREIYQIYAALEPSWNFSNRKSLLFEDAAISFVLRYVSMNEAANLRLGLYNLLHLDKKYNNRIAMSGVFYISLCKPSLEFVMNGSNGDIIEGGSTRCGFSAASVLTWLEKYLSIKNKKWEDLIKENAESLLEIEREPSVEMNSQISQKLSF